MFHHDGRDYAAAVNEAQKHLEDEIQRRSKQAEGVVERVIDEVPVDRLPFISSLNFDVDRTTPVPSVRVRNRGVRKSFDEPLHKNALSQVCTVLGMPQKFASDLLVHENQEAATALVAHNLNSLVAMAPEKRVLLRSVKENVRSVLSDSYLRVSGPELMEEFATVCQALGARVLEGSMGDLRFSMKAVIAQVRRVGPVGGEEVITYGVCLSNSDHGCGSLSVQLFVLRVWCTNAAKMENPLRRVHLGRKLDADLILQQDTIHAEMVLTRKLLRDNVRSLLAPARIAALTAAVDGAMRTNLTDPRKAFDDLVKRGLSRGIVRRVEETFNDDALDIRALPPQRNAWRLSNTLSWLAQSASGLSAEDRMALEDEAGNILQHPKQSH